MRKILHLNELLNFYDYRVDSSLGHASAINAVLGKDLGLALLVHFLKSLGLEVAVLNGLCSQGNQGALRLDKWIVVKSSTESIIFQVGIKILSSHAIGGRRVEVGRDDEYMRQFRLERWHHHFNGDEQVPSGRTTRVVLEEMQVPIAYRNYKHEALLCFWEPLHPLGELEAFFEVDVRGEVFKKLKIFSMSNYISQLLKITEILEIEMADAYASIDWLKKIYN
jgi:hypothetical protein